MMREIENTNPANKNKNVKNKTKNGGIIWEFINISKVYQI